MSHSCSFVSFISDFITNNCHFIIHNVSICHNFNFKSQYIYFVIVGLIATFQPCVTLYSLWSQTFLIKFLPKKWSALFYPHLINFIVLHSYRMSSVVSFVSIFFFISPQEFQQKHLQQSWYFYKTWLRTMKATSEQQHFPLESVAQRTEPEFSRSRAAVRSERCII